MPSLITTRTGDKILVDNSTSDISERVTQSRRPGGMVILIELTLYRSTPRRTVYVNIQEIESIREDTP